MPFRSALDVAGKKNTVVWMFSSLRANRLQQRPMPWELQGTVEGYCLSGFYSVYLSGNSLQNSCFIARADGEFLICLIVVHIPNNTYRLLTTKNNFKYWLEDEKKSRLTLLACILLIACAITLIAAYTLRIEVGYVVASALALTGTVFWVNAE